MKKIFFLFAITLATFSCSTKENLAEIEETKPELSVTKLENSNIVEQFSSFLNTNSHYTDLDFENGIEVFDNEMFCYMIPLQNNPNILVGGYSYNGKDIISYFYFEENEDSYNFYDKNNIQIAKAELFEDNESFSITRMQTTKASNEEWCAIGMTVVGAAVGYFFIPVTGGLSAIGYATCWGLVTALVCK